MDFLTVGGPRGMDCFVPRAVLRLISAGNTEEKDFLWIGLKEWKLLFQELITYLCTLCSHVKREENCLIVSGGHPAEGSGYSRLDWDNLGSLPSLIKLDVEQSICIRDMP